MIRFTGRGILLDIEGTTSSVRFVYDVMFPFARRELPAYLDAHWGEASLVTACEQMARDAEHDSAAQWLGDKSLDAQKKAVIAEAIRLMDADAKTTGLKTLQGLVWEAGFESGELQAHIYDDVLPALEAWTNAGVDVCIYSSGSIQAQKLFFGHTLHGDLLRFFRAHFDTTTGGKKETGSYWKILEQWGLPGVDVLFVSDVVGELNAARDAGMQTALCMRPENGDPGIHSHPEVRTLMQIEPAANEGRGTRVEGRG